MLDEDRVQEIRDRIADRYTATELIEMLDVPVETLIVEYWCLILRNPLLLSEVGAETEEEEDTDSDIS